LSAARLREALAKALARWTPAPGTEDVAVWVECDKVLAETAPYDPYAPWIEALRDPDPKVREVAAACLHRAERHPEFEYTSTDTARKSNTTLRPEGEGWEPNDRVPWHRYEAGVLISEHWRNWDRFEFHETTYWRRRKVHERNEELEDLAANPEDLREAVRDGVRDALAPLRERLDHLQTKHSVTLTLKSGRVIDGTLFDVDVREKFLSLCELDEVFLFAECTSVIERATGNDLLPTWRAQCA
jgi:hypothetical protein